MLTKKIFFLFSKSTSTIFLYSIFATILTFFLFISFNNELLFWLFLTSIPIILLLLFLKTFYIYYLLIAFLFIPFSISAVYFSVLITCLIFISFILNFQNIQHNTFEHIKENKYYFLYFLLCVPSFINVYNFQRSLLLTINMVAFIILLNVTSLVINNKKKLINVIILYLLFVLANSFHVIIDGIITKSRVFGFAGIMFVDYVGFGILIILIQLIFKKKNFLNLLILITLITASLITQTRNAWLATIFTISCVSLFLLFKYKLFKIKRKTILLGLILMLFVGASSYFVINKMNTSIQERTTEITQIDKSFDNEGKIQNSFLTRLMIWHTAYNAFMKHPIVGIGLYAFPYSSQLYYTIPKSFYTTYVKGLSPHLGYLAVLTETGIIGFIGFVIFLIFSLKYTLKTFNVMKNKDDLVILLTLFSCQLYIYISLFLTDAWLWGNGIVFWGIIQGLIIAFRNQINQQQYEII